MPLTLSIPQMVLTILTFLVGLINVAIQTKKIFNQWDVPAKAMPYVVVLGSFLGGVLVSFQSMNPLVLTGAAIFFACFAGLQNLLVGAAPAIASHLFGAAVNQKRPAPTSEKDTDEVTPVEVPRPNL